MYNFMVTCTNLLTSRSKYKKDTDNFEIYIWKINKII